MHSRAYLALLAGLAACAPVSDRIDDLTGTTIQERCVYRVAALTAYDTAQVLGLTPEISDTVAELYRAYVDAVCVPESFPAPGAE
jgi:hypothetical protein